MKALLSGKEIGPVYQSDKYLGDIECYFVLENGLPKRVKVKKMELKNESK